MNGISLQFTTKGTAVLLLFFLLVSLMLNLTFLISESITFSGCSHFRNRDPIFSLFRSKSLSSLEHKLLMRKV